MLAIRHVPCRAKPVRVQVPLRRVPPSVKGFPSRHLRGAVAVGTALALRAPRPRLRAMATAVSPVASPADVDVVMFSRPGCGFCAKAKALLARRQVRFAVVDVNAEPERIDEAQRRSGGSTFPQILVGSKCLGGAKKNEEE
eukprot:Skav222575  [mRNA]  locus=scaffold791:270972:271574:+ [translate_table: standard]